MANVHGIVTHKAMGLDLCQCPLVHLYLPICLVPGDVPAFTPALGTIRVRCCMVSNDSLKAMAWFEEMIG